MNLTDLTAQQNSLRTQIQLIPLKIDKIKTIAGCDCSLIDENTLFCVFVLFSYPHLVQLEIATTVATIHMPYVPGFLSFREIPGLLTCFQKLSTAPDLIMVDGNGILHPRRMGIATHLGILLNLPTIGIAKKKLTGQYQIPTNTKFDYTPVIHQKEKIAYALRAKPNTNPVFVSPGNLCTLDDALTFTLTTYGKYRLPEPTRLADKYSKILKPKEPTLPKVDSL